MASIKIEPVPLIFAFYGIAVFVLYLRRLQVLRDFPSLKLYTGLTDNFPLVSIIIPVRNEEDAIEQCLISLLNSRYRNKEIIVVDGYSTDETPKILSKYKDRVTILQEPPLKLGWIGKNLACYFGQQFAHGDILLFTDGDTIHHEYCLSSAVSYMMRENVDMLSLWPEMVMETFWEKTVLPYIFKTFFLAFEGKKVNDERSTKWAAFGPYILIKRNAYDSIGGHASVRGSLEEDYRLAELLKSANKRTRILSSNGLVKTRMYSNFKEIWEGWVKNSFEGFGFKVGAIVCEVFYSFLLGILPFVLFLVTLIAFISGNVTTDPLLASLLMVLTVVLGEALVYRMMKYRYQYAIFVPCATAIYIGILIHSTYLGLTKKGIRWKDRIYKYRNELSNL